MKKGKSIKFYHTTVEQYREGRIAGKKTKAATITVFLNGVLIQDHYEIKGSTEYIGFPKNNAHGDGPIVLQDHGDMSGVGYRNIWLRKLD